MSTINVLDDAEMRAYAMWEWDDEFSQMWEDHHARQARHFGLMARCYIALAQDPAGAALAAREAFHAAAKVIQCREVRAGRSAGLTMREDVK